MTRNYVLPDDLFKSGSDMDFRGLAPRNKSCCDSPSQINCLVIR